MSEEQASESPEAKFYSGMWGFLERPAVHLFLILLVAFFVYSNTFNVPFIFDDWITIVENPLIKDLSNIPTIISASEGAFASRPLMHITFALNYYFGGLETWGYHAVNLAIHLINGILVYLLVAITGSLMDYSRRHIRLAAVFSTVLFVFHPVQTEAVTYIVSRSVLLATTFFLLGMVLFAKAVTSERRKALYIAGLLITSLLGMGSRENFATFPVMLLLYDLLFVSRFSFREIVRHYKAYMPVMLSLGYLAFIVFNNTYYRDVESLGVGISPKDYFLTQFNVHWTYLRLLALPINQNIDYDYPVATTLFRLPTLLAFLGYLGLWAAVIALARKRPVLSFSMLWFLVTLIPISFGVTLMELRLNDVIFEHRLYLPGAGVIMGISAVLLFVLGKLQDRKMSIAVGLFLIILVPALSVASYQRNAVWGSEIGLWEDAVRKSPRKPRIYYSLGILYHRSLGLRDKAKEHFRYAMKLDPGFSDPYFGLGMLYLDEGREDMARREFARPHLILGDKYNSGGLYERAMEQYLAAINFDPEFAEAHNGLGIVYGRMGQHEKAIERFRIAIKLRPGYAEAHNNLGIAYTNIGLLEKADEHFRLARELSREK